MNFSQEFLKKAVPNGDIEGIIKGIPYARTIGVECLKVGEELIFKLPQKDSNLGNPTLPALHGGVIGGFMETAGILYVMMSTESSSIPKVVDISLDYLSPGHHRDTFAACEMVRQGKKIANVRITAFQKTQQKPIATARAHFLLT